MTKGRKFKIAIIAGACAIILVAAAIIWGILAPTSTVAASYGLGKYIYEKDVTTYIQTYQSQEGMLDSGDDEWSAFLQEQGLTPETLRERTIHQLLYDALIREKCAQLGIVATEEEIDNATSSFREAMSLGSEDVWNQTLAMYGQTQEGFDSVYELAILKQKLIDEQVEAQQPTDDDVKEYIDALSSQGVDSTKHSFAFKISRPTDPSDTSVLDQANSIREQFLASDKTSSSFAAYVELFSDNDSLKQTQGANGWDLDQAEYSEDYVNALSDLELGDVSEVFVDGDDYCFIFVSDSYNFPAAGTQDIELANVPESLLEYFKDGASRLLTNDTGEAYVEQMITDANPVYNPMPEDVPYNVNA